MTPTVGVLKFGWLRKLKDSARNCTVSVSESSPRSRLRTDQRVSNDRPGKRRIDERLAGVARIDGV
jgi:hypothetical protein